MMIAFSILLFSHMLPFIFFHSQVDYLNLKSEERNLFKAIPSFGGEKLWEMERINP